MPNIRPSSDLRNKYNETVYITKNGAGDLAVMIIQTYENLVVKFELHSMLEKGLEDISQGRVTPARDVFEKIESRVTSEKIPSNDR